MKTYASLVVLTPLALALGVVIGCKHPSPPLEQQETVLPGRHMSEHQVADIASKELPDSGFQCQFNHGTWDILEFQKGVFGISSITTNADGRIFIRSTNATRLVLKVRDADGKVERVNTP